MEQVLRPYPVPLSVFILLLAAASECSRQLINSNRLSMGFQTIRPVLKRFSSKCWA